ncbi:mismatch repair endonuclease PMS2 [Trichomycterus rosablanca]|uniref:mismatch repair endonuclease PMS2 n=1 Tax=Trichomycterus rosablanca TaxID=2290929 RepID=UPI002F34F484
MVDACKTKELVIDFRKKSHHTTPVSIQGLDIEMVKEYKYLGVHLNNKLDCVERISWSACIHGSQQVHLGVRLVMPSTTQPYPSSWLFTLYTALSFHYSSSEQARAIKVIDKHSVHQICSGQVVLSLATAVKELVENSIDAGATQVDIRLKENGIDLVEVSDNGKGVEEENFEGLTLKHHTSKLRDFSDLIRVATFGFRGEALSSLCALSDLTVVTCHESSHVGTRLVFDHNGHLISRAPHPRQQGTTVNLQQLFYTLPVRHKEFQRNIKKEFSKMVHVLQSYCIISTGVRITCTNQIGQGKRSTVACTSGSHSMRDNIGALFGPKQLQTLIPFQQISPTENIKEDYGLNEAELPKDLFTISGYVSQADHGVGRSATDRQFFFINKRPCDPSKVAKVVNEVYHMFNRHQYPFVALNISVASECVDVNVTPDKRQIFLQEEKLLLAVLKSSLIAMYETGVNKISLNHTPQLIASFSRSTDSADSSECSQTAVKHDGTSEDFSETSSPTTKSSLNLAGLKAAFSKQQVSGSGTKTLTSKTVCNVPAQKTMQSFIQCSEKTSYMKSSSADSSNKMVKFPLKASLSRLKNFGYGSTVNADSGLSEQDSVTRTSETLCENGSEIDCRDDSVMDEPIIKTEPNKEPVSEGHNVLEPLEQEMESVTCSDRIFSPEAKKPRWDDVPSEMSPFLAARDTSCGLFDRPVSMQKKTVSIQFSFTELARRMQRLKAQQKEQSDREPKFRRFRAKINPGENQSAEDELKKEISKDMFKDMEIIGQFNLGFIITRFKSDLFMIDQHATDEKYNFEMLQQHTVLQGQKLIVPQNLHLPAVSETVLIDNLEIFKKNGFDFLIDESEPVMERVKLVSLPTSKNWTFGTGDIDELIFMLSDCPGVMCRPSRVRQMFASRACRKSVMIGTALNTSEMKKLVVHMGEIVQPWNCPHGRPTIRHLVNLDVITQD